jgi:hypothetical protein
LSRNINSTLAAKFGGANSDGFARDSGRGIDVRSLVVAPNAFTLVFVHFLHPRTTSEFSVSDLSPSVRLPILVHYYEEKNRPGWQVQEACEETHQDWRKLLWKVSGRETEKNRARE